MTQYAYRARDRRGGTISGVMTAESQDELAQRLRVQGMSVLSITQRGRAGNGILGTLSSISVGSPRIKQADIVLFANQLAVMVDTGVPLAEALDAIVQQTSNPTLQRVLGRVAEAVESGETFSDALEEYPKHFSTMFVSLVRAGEASGNLGPMLVNVAEYLVDAQETRRRVLGSLAYPIFMASLAAVVLVVLLAYVLPKFTKIYAHKGDVLPVPTQVLLSASQFVTGHWIWLVCGAAALAAGLVLFLKTAVGRRLADTLKLRMPVIGDVCRKYYIARSFRALGTMVAAGVPVITALEITRRTMSNCHFQAVFDRAIERVSSGETLSDQFFATEFVPVTTAQMIFAGEKSGRLGQVLLKVSEFCDRDLKDAMKTLTTLLEPAMIAGMGLLVGGVAISLLLPMFTINKTLTK
jgi:type II secretory pathway component PulF